MGTGCTNSAGQNLFEKTTLDGVVVYTGPSKKQLGICTGDRLNEIEAVILQKLIDYSTGIGISIPIDLSTCDVFTDCITCCNNQCTDLPCLLDCYKTAICNLKSLLDTNITTITDALSGPYNIGCLPVASNATLKVLIQALISGYCTLVSNVATMGATINNINNNSTITIGDFILNSLNTCQGIGTVVKTGTGASASVSFKGFVPVGAIIPYAGTTSGKFDSTGLGLTGTDVCGFALCNGLNGTVDMRGQVPVGSTGGMGGGTLPSNATGDSYILGDKVGQSAITLSASQAPIGSHTHTVTDPGHNHGMSFERVTFKQASNATEVLGVALNNSTLGYTDSTTGVVVPPSFPQATATIMKAKTGITIGTTSGNAATSHENRQPSTALYYIQRIA